MLRLLQINGKILLTNTTSVKDPLHLGADPDPHLWLMDLDPDPTPDLTPFLSDFKNAGERGPAEAAVAAAIKGQDFVINLLKNQFSLFFSIFIII